MQHFEKTLDSETVYDGKIIKVLRDKALLEDGSAATREVVRHQGASAVLAVDGEGRAFFVKQFRYPVGRVLFEAPAGKIDPGEAPLACAKRELAEECGVAAKKWTELGPLLSSPGFCDEVIWLFLAEELSDVGQNLDSDEFLDVVKMPLREAREAVLKGAVPDAKTQVLVLKTAEILGK